MIISLNFELITFHFEAPSFSLINPYFLLSSTDGDHHEKPNDHQAQPKEDSLKLQDVKEVATLCRKLLFMEEVISDSSQKFPVFVCTFGLDQVDPSLEGPLGFED